MTPLASHKTKQPPAILFAEDTRLSPAQRRELKRRQQKLAAYESALASGANKGQAARMAGIAPVTCWRYQQSLAREGLRGLIPHFDRAGRRRAIEKHRLTPAALSTVQRLFLATGSSVCAWRAFAEMPSCPPDLANVIRSTETLPPYLLAAARPRRQSATIYHGQGFQFVFTGPNSKRQAAA